MSLNIRALSDPSTTAYGGGPPPRDKLGGQTGQKLELAARSFNVLVRIDRLTSSHPYGWVSEKRKLLRLEAGNAVFLN
jgi:hypothetical protein